MLAVLALSTTSKWRAPRARSRPSGYKCLLNAGLGTIIQSGAALSGVTGGGLDIWTPAPPPSPVHSVSSLCLSQAPHPVSLSAPAHTLDLVTVCPCLTMSSQSWKVRVWIYTQIWWSLLLLIGLYDVIIQSAWGPNRFACVVSVYESLTPSVPASCDCRRPQHPPPALCPGQLFLCLSLIYEFDFDFDPPPLTRKQASRLWPVHLMAPAAQWPTVANGKLIIQLLWLLWAPDSLIHPYTIPGIVKSLNSGLQNCHLNDIPRHHGILQSIKGQVFYLTKIF